MPITSGTWQCNSFFFTFSLYVSFTVFKIILNMKNIQLVAFQSPYAQLLASTTLTKLISRNTVSLSLQQKIDISKFNLYVNFTFDWVLDWVWIDYFIEEMSNV